jgi:hypothetical protein
VIAGTVVDAVGDHAPKVSLTRARTLTVYDPPGRPVNVRLVVVSLKLVVAAIGVPAVVLPANHKSYPVAPDTAFHDTASLPAPGPDTTGVETVPTVVADTTDRLSGTAAAMHAAATTQATILERTGWGRGRRLNGMDRTVYALRVQATHRRCEFSGPHAGGGRRQDRLPKPGLHRRLASSRGVHNVVPGDAGTMGTGEVMPARPPGADMTDQPGEDRPTETELLTAELFCRLGAIRWQIHNLERGRPADLTEDKRVAWEMLHRERLALATAVLSERSSAELERLGAVVASAPGVHDDFRSAAQAWFDVSRFERICTTAASASGNPSRYMEIVEALDGLCAPPRPPDGSDAAVSLQSLRDDLGEVTDMIVKLHRALPRRCVDSLTHGGTDHDRADLETAAHCGLIRAIASFDPDTGRFSTWAWRRIRRELVSAGRGEL